MHIRTADRGVTHISPALGDHAKRVCVLARRELGALAVTEHGPCKGIGTEMRFGSGRACQRTDRVEWDFWQARSGQGHAMPALSGEVGLGGWGGGGGGGHVLGFLARFFC
jgi:hypothetical protein